MPKAKLTHLITALTGIFGETESAVREYARRLREAGLIATGQSGRYGGAPMTPQDAAILLTALMASNHAAHAPEAAKHYIRTRPMELAGKSQDYSGVLLRGLASLPAEHNFLDALAAIIGASADGSMKEAYGKYWHLHLIQITAITPWGCSIVGDIRIGRRIVPRRTRPRIIARGISRVVQYVEVGKPIWHTKSFMKWNAERSALSLEENLAGLTGEGEQHRIVRGIVISRLGAALRGDALE